MTNVKKSTPSTASQARRERNRTRNENQHKANLHELTGAGITDSYPRPSKLIRKLNRAGDAGVRARRQAHIDREVKAQARTADKTARAARQATAATNREAMSATLRDVAASIGKHE